MHPVIVVPANDTANLCARAQDLADQLGAPFRLRRRRTWAAVIREENADAIVVVRTRGLEYHHSDTVFAYHPGLSGLRILALKRGESDHMVQAMGLKSGDYLLDCTLGLASDAVVASFVVGERGRVVGVEASSVVAAIVAAGLHDYDFPKDPQVEEAMRRVQVLAGDHLDHLRRMPDRSFDVVYFDPMFRHAIEESDGIGPLRLLANHEPIGRAAIAEAKRVARRCVVVKERSGSGEFDRLGVDRIVGGRYGPIAYGVIDIE